MNRHEFMGSGERADDQTDVPPLGGVQDHYETDLGDALYCLTDELKTADEFDEGAVLSFREKLAQVDILAEDAVGASTSMSFDESPMWTAQSRARDLYALYVNFAASPRTALLNDIYQLQHELMDSADELAALTASGRTPAIDLDQVAQASPSVTVRNDFTHFEDYPETGTTDVHLQTLPNDEIQISACLSDGDDDEVTAALEMDADAAEHLAAQLLSFAEKARAGKSWTTA